MKLTTRTRYGIRMLIYIASKNSSEATTLQEISHNQDISLKYLEKISKILKESGYIWGKRGPGGGYELLKPAEEIKLGDLVQVLEGNLDFVDCWFNQKPCPRINECKSRIVWNELEKLIYNRLNYVTLSDLIQDNKSCQQLIAEEIHSTDNKQ